MILSFGEVPQPHEVLTLVYAYTEADPETFFKKDERGEQILPIDYVMAVVDMLIKAAQEQFKANGLKNIQIKIIPGKNKEGKDIYRIFGMATAIRVHLNYQMPTI